MAAKVGIAFYLEWVLIKIYQGLFFKVEGKLEGISYCVLRIEVFEAGGFGDGEYRLIEEHEKKQGSFVLCDKGMMQTRLEYELFAQTTILIWKCR